MGHGGSEVVSYPHAVWGMGGLDTMTSQGTRQGHSWSHVHHEASIKVTEMIVEGLGSLHE